MKGKRLLTYFIVCSCVLMLMFLFVFQPSEFKISNGDTAFFGSACQVANETERRYTPVNLRIIIITFNRPNSVLRLLRSLNNARYDGDKVIVDIWVDRSKNGIVSIETITKVQQFHFSAGLCHLHIRDHHGGLRKQWLEVR